MVRVHLEKDNLFSTFKCCRPFPRTCQFCSSLVAVGSQLKPCTIKSFAQEGLLRVQCWFWIKRFKTQTAKALSPAKLSRISFIIIISTLTWFWHHLSHVWIWVIAFYILHAHQMLTPLKMWNIAMTWSSGSTLLSRLMSWAEMSFLQRSSLLHRSQRQAPFTWTFTEAVQFKGGGGAQGQNIGIVTQVMSHCSPLVIPLHYPISSITPPHCPLQPTQI